MPTSLVRGLRAHLWLPLLILAVLDLPAGAAESLPDSTIADRWTLANGLTVVTRHIPRISRVSITVCYGLGSSQDPPGREGQARLLAELAYCGVAGDTPERTREEMASLRPMGWNSRVAPNSTQFTEIASHGTFAGVLSQVAARAHGVEVTEAFLRSAAATVKRDLAEQYAGRIDLVLYHQVRGLAEGALPDRMSRYASGKGIEGMALAEVHERLATLFVPANAVLAIAGNLAGYDVRRMVEAQFGDIPAGTKATAPAPRTLQSGSRVARLASARDAAMVVAILAPALGDSLHPSFCVNSLLLGSFLRNRWGPPPPPLTARFEFSIVDEPDLVRLYLPVQPSAPDSSLDANELIYSLSELPVATANPNAYRDMVDNVEWMLGGPLPRAVLLRMQDEPGAIHTLSSSMAARAHWGDEDFWRNYREGMRQAADMGFASWPSYYITRENQAEVRILPQGR